MTSKGTATGTIAGRPKRLWIPLVILILGGASSAVIWYIPPVDMERMVRSMVVFWSIIPGIGILLTLWWLFGSGVRWWVRGVGLLVVGALLAGIIRWEELENDGDLVPILTFRWNQSRFANLGLGTTKLLAPVVLVPETTADFPEFRGRQRDGVASGPGLNPDWRTFPPPLLWRHPVGGGYAAFAVSGNTAVTIEQRHQQEAVVCYDTTTGQELWIYSYPARFSERLGGEGPRATPTISGTEVFSLGATGRLVCLDRATGGQKWVVDILQDNDNLSWGMSGSPLVYDQVVVVNPGTQKDSASGRALVAYNRNTGQEVWRAGNNPAGYCSPMLASLAGQRFILIFDGKGLAGHDAATGKELWRYPWETEYGINVAQPILLEGDRVFITSGYNKGCSLLQVSQKDGTWSVVPVWANEMSRALRCRFTSPVAHQGFIYGLDEGILVCLDPATGKTRWKGERYGHGQLLRFQDLLLVLSETGKLALVEANHLKAHELGRFSALEGDKTWNTPALANGKVFLRNHKEMACFDLRVQK